MKKYLFFAINLLVAVGMSAQPPGGGGRPGGPPPRGEMPSRSSSEGKLILEHFPEIPDLTLQQREKVGSVLSKERENVEKQIQKKREIEKEITPELSDKKLKEKQEKIEKINKKIQDIRNKSNNKIQKELSEEQYLVFLEKREDFKFKRQSPKRQGMPQRNNESNSDERPPFPPQGESNDVFFE